MITSPEELRAEIRRLGVSDPDPHRVTEKLLTRLDDTEAQLIARVTLHEYVRHVLVRPLASQEPQATYRTASGKTTVSWKTRGIIDHVEAELARSVFTASGWKFFRECGVDDLAFMATTRRQRADELVAEADRFEATQAALREAGVGTVGELDRGVLSRLLGE